jgi:hypothetical protein
VPKVGRPVRARALPLPGAILAVQLAICWKPRVSGGTSSLSHRIITVAAMSSDKPSGAGNQQERPLAAEWVVGFVDGEGCSSLFLSNTLSKRRKLTTFAAFGGWCD